ncbi:hypothetical protein C8R43DRAFT_954809 [Mycena crocata]|nr:hypothetical protein C8R43DRAFT_954809 [Mycena crocata]
MHPQSTRRIRNPQGTRARKHPPPHASRFTPYVSSERHISEDERLPRSAPSPIEDDNTRHDTTPQKTSHLCAVSPEGTPPVPKHPTSPECEPSRREGANTDALRELATTRDALSVARILLLPAPPPAPKNPPRYVTARIQRVHLRATKAPCASADAKNETKKGANRYQACNPQGRIVSQVHHGETEGAPKKRDVLRTSPRMVWRASHIAHRAHDRAKWNVGCGMWDVGRVRGERTREMGRTRRKVQVQVQVQV